MSEARRSRSGGRRPLTPTERRFVLQVREETRNLRASYRRLSRLGEAVRERLAQPSEGDDRLLALLAGILEHALLELEEAWAELAGSFSSEGLDFVRRKAKRKER